MEDVANDDADKGEGEGPGETDGETKVEEERDGCIIPDPVCIVIALGIP
jgi:hypothetical protein